MHSCWLLRVSTSKWSMPSERMRQRYSYFLCILLRSKMNICVVCSNMCSNVEHISCPFRVAFSISKCLCCCHCCCFLSHWACFSVYMCCCIWAKCIHQLHNLHVNFLGAWIVSHCSCSPPPLLLSRILFDHANWSRKTGSAIKEISSSNQDALLICLCIHGFHSHYLFMRRAALIVNSI